MHAKKPRLPSALIPHWGVSSQVINQKSRRCVCNAFPSRGRFEVSRKQLVSPPKKTVSGCYRNKKRRSESGLISSRALGPLGPKSCASPELRDADMGRLPVVPPSHRRSMDALISRRGEARRRSFTAACQPHERGRAQHGGQRETNRLHHDFHSQNRAD